MFELILIVLLSPVLIVLGVIAIIYAILGFTCLMCAVFDRLFRKIGEKKNE